MLIKCQGKRIDKIIKLSVAYKFKQKKSIYVNMCVVKVRQDITFGKGCWYIIVIEIDAR